MMLPIFLEIIFIYSHMRYLIRFNENLNENSDWTETPEGLYKKFQFQDFTEAMHFVNTASKIIYEQNHHPKITINSNIVEIWSKTHDTNSITEKDSSLADALDSITGDDNLNLTKKEKQVLNLLKKGKTYKEISDELGTSFNTINFHIKNLYKKFGVNSLGQLLSKKIFL